MSSSTENMTDEDYHDYVVQYVYPNTLEFVAIPVFFILLIVGLVGNFLVVFVVVRNESMRTITNVFLVNLALADFLVLLFCLPFTVLWDITNTWFFGTPLCKIIVYIQTVSISVSIITLTCISVERWHAICNPLSFKSTFERTRLTLIVTWVVSLLLSFPELVILETKPFDFARPNFTSHYFTMCTDTWGPYYQTIYQLCQLAILYFFPLILMAVMYGQISYVLWVKSVPPSDPCLSVNRNDSPPSGQWNHHKHKSCMDQSKEKEILNRRKAAKMLIAVVLLFAVCYFPTHALNLIKLFVDVKTDNEYMDTLLHLFLMRFLCYFNSCINPIIYNFMSEKFQREFRRACCCLNSKFRTPSASRFSTLGAAENATLLAQSRRHDEHSQNFAC